MWLCESWHRLSVLWTHTVKFPKPIGSFKALHHHPTYPCRFAQHFYSSWAVRYESFSSFDPNNFPTTVMQDHRTTSLEIHDGATSSAEQLSQTDSSSRSVYTSSQDWVYIRWFGEAGGGVALDVDFTFFREAGKFGQMGLREGESIRLHITVVC